VRGKTEKDDIILEGKIYPFFTDMRLMTIEQQDDGFIGKAACLPPRSRLRYEILFEPLETDLIVSPAIFRSGQPVSDPLSVDSS